MDALEWSIQGDYMVPELEEMHPFQEATCERTVEEKEERNFHK